jgi:hypothetical protein
MSKYNVYRTRLYMSNKEEYGRETLHIMKSTHLSFLKISMYNDNLSYQFSID